MKGRDLCAVFLFLVASGSCQQCEEDWILSSFSNKCFYVSPGDTQSHTLTQAKDTCVGMGAQLASLALQSDIEVLEMYQQISGSQYWIDLYADDSDCGSRLCLPWLWGDGLEFTQNWAATNWFPGEPGTGEKYARLRELKWAGISQSMRYGYICQKEAVMISTESPTTPTTSTQTTTTASTTSTTTTASTTTVQTTQTTSTVPTTESSTPTIPSTPTTPTTKTTPSSPSSTSTTQSPTLPQSTFTQSTSQTDPTSSSVDSSDQTESQDVSTISSTTLKSTTDNVTPDTGPVVSGFDSMKLLGGGLGVLFAGLILVIVGCILLRKQDRKRSSGVLDSESITYTNQAYTVEEKTNRYSSLSDTETPQTGNNNNTELTLKDSGLKDEEDPYYSTVKDVDHNDVFVDDGLYATVDSTSKAKTVSSSEDGSLSSKSKLYNSVDKDENGPVRIEKNDKAKGPISDDGFRISDLYSKPMKFKKMPNK